MRIIFFTRSLNVGGAERQIVALASGLKKKGHDVSVLLMYSGGSFQTDLETAGVRIVFLDKKGRWDIFGFFVRLLKATRKIDPDILHSYLTTSNILAAALKPFCRRTKIVWGIRSSYMNLAKYDRVTRLTYGLERRLSPVADMIIFNSEAGRKILTGNGYKADRAIVIPNGIDTKTYHADKRGAVRLRHEWGARPETKIVGVAARIDPVKDHETFLRAAYLLSKNRDDLCFVCVGAGTEKRTDRMRALTADLGLLNKVIWTGAMENMPTVYSAFDIAVLCSYGEGFANVIGEAMACQVPCVVTDVGDLRWIVGDTGIVVPARQPDKLAEGITCMLEKIEAAQSDDPGLTARKRIESMFNVAALINRTSEALLKLV